MPNILANDEVFPEFIQNAATPENIAGAALEIVAGRIAPRPNQKPAGGNGFIPWQPRRQHARGHGDFEFVQLRIVLVLLPVFVLDFQIFDCKDEEDLLLPLRRLAYADGITARAVAD